MEEFNLAKEAFSELKQKLKEFKEQVDGSEKVLKSILDELIKEKGEE